MLSDEFDGYILGVTRQSTALLYDGYSIQYYTTELNNLELIIW